LKKENFDHVGSKTILTLIKNNSNFSNTLLLVASTRNIMTLIMARS